MEIINYIDNTERAAIIADMAAAEQQLVEDQIYLDGRRRLIFATTPVVTDYAAEYAAATTQAAKIDVIARRLGLVKHVELAK